MFDPTLTYKTNDGREFDIFQMSDGIGRHANEKGSYAAYSYYFAVYPKEDGNRKIDDHWSVACVFTYSLWVIWEKILDRKIQESELHELSIERLKFSLDMNDRSHEFWFTSENTLGHSSRTPQDVLGQLKRRTFGRLAPQIVTKIRKRFEELQISFMDAKLGPLFQSIDERIWDDIEKDAYAEERFVYQINALGVLIDGMQWKKRIRIQPKDETGSISCLKQYLVEQGLSQDKVDKIVEPLRAIKIIRKQYPVHIGTSEVLQRAEKTIGIASADMYQEKWRKVLEKIQDVLESIPDPK